MNPEPVSILELERLHLGELSPERAAEVRARMADDADAQAIFADITAGERLPPLPEPPPRRFDLRWLLVPAAAAAALLLWVARPAPPDVLVKGGELSIGLVAQRGDQLVDVEGRARADDAIKVLVTCAPPEVRRVDVVVFQADGASFPLGDARTVQCGNRVPVPGAFRLSPGRAQVCAALDAPLSRGSTAPAELPDSAVCVTVEAD